MKKKKSKKNKRNKLMILSTVIMVVFVGVIFLKNLSKPVYYNSSKNGRVCGHGYFLQVTIFGNSCKPCPKGFYCPGDDSRVKCPNSNIVTTASEGNTSSKDCNVCKDSKKWYNGSSCVSCTAPYYCEKGSKHLCEKGKTIKKNGATSSKDCVTVTCNKNQYIKDGVCKACPKDHYCNGVDAKSCGTNRTIKSGAQPTSSSACVCKSGTYLPGSTSICIICEVGKSCNNNKMTACPLGTYQDERGKGSCKTCPNNKSSTKVGATKASECTVCKAGTYLSNGKCVSCPSGFTSPINSKSKSSCTMTVPAGKYIKCNSSGCTVNACTGNTYSTAKTVSYSTTLKTSCTSCAKGKVANSNNTSCITQTAKCKSGQYNIKNQCKSCPGCNGMVCFTTPSNATSIGECSTTVPAGKYITCNSSACTVSACTGNTYSTAKKVNFSSSLRTTCTSCGTMKANSTHTGCI